MQNIKCLKEIHNKRKGSCNYNKNVARNLVQFTQQNTQMQTYFITNIYINNI